MDVQVKDFQKERHGFQARFLGYLALGHCEGVGIAVGVATGLQPPVELAVMDQQHAVAGLIEAMGVANPKGKQHSTAARAMRLISRRAG